jgi:hypothetical protein
MRLTLRTMLAYLDDILDPKDAEELSQKIEESKFASELVHRIRSSTRRLRLGAPKLEGRGMGLDPNTVAEYLDNTLTAEHVPDFERVCLESDVHLAEVASCHQVLTLVLGEPAEVQETLRDRIYQIGRHADKEVPGPSVDSSSVPPSTPTPSTEPRPTVSGNGLLLSTKTARGVATPKGVTGRRGADSGVGLRALAIMLLWLLGGFLTAFVALRALGPFDAKHPVWQFMAGDDSEPVAQGPKGKGTTEQLAENGADSSSSPLQSSSPAVKPLLKGESPVIPQETGRQPSAPPSPPPDSTPGTDGGVEVKPSPAVPAAPDSSVMTPPSTTPPSKTPADVVPAKDTVGKPPAEAETPQNAPSAPQPQVPTTVGRSISEEHVLGRFDSATSSWFRLAPDSPISVHDQLISFPTYRPQILLAPNVKTTFSGQTKGKVAESAEPETPHLSIEYGRATVVSSMADRGVQIRFDFAGRNGLVILSDAESEVALEVIPYLPLGSDPREAVGHRIVRLYGVTGEIAWSEGAGPLKIGPGQVLQLIDDKPGEVVATGAIPAWVDGKDLSDIDRLGSLGLRQALVPGRPLSLSLAEKAEFRQAEVRALACRCLVCLDLFEPILRALNDESQHAYWRGHFDALRVAIARNQESASLLLKSLEGLQPDDASRLFRLLWGYSPAQLEEGGAKELVELLEHKAMIGRVLAIENLRRITDMTFIFRPEQPLAQQKSRLMKWRKSLESGEIRYKSPAPDFPSLPAGPASGGPKPAKPGTR